MNLDLTSFMTGLACGITFTASVVVGWVAERQRRKRKRDQELGNVWHELERRTR